MTLVLRVSALAPEPEIIARAAQVIRAGRLVAFPTETVYGLGADALDSVAVAAIYAAKGRPATDPLIVHIAQAEQLQALAVEIPPLAVELGRRFWPGPLTLVLKRSPAVPANLSAGRDTIAVRQPAHPVAAALIEASGRPIAAPSANLFSRPSPTTAGHVLHDLEGRIDLILDGGPTSVGIESTVLDLTLDVPAVLRPGGLPVETLRGIIPGLVVAGRTLSPGEAAASPGQLLRHYAPRARLLLFSGPREAVLNQMRRTLQDSRAGGQTTGVLVPDEDRSVFAGLGVRLFPLGPLSDLDLVAHNLFAGLRELDSLELDLILARDLGRAGLGLAIWDRLFRAAEGRVITVA